MARRPYPPGASTSPISAALDKTNIPCVYRDEQRLVECHSRNLEFRALHLKYLRLDKSLVRKNGRHVIVLLGDAATVPSENTLGELRSLFLYGVLGAASLTEAMLVDSGLSTSWGVCQPTAKMEDYCRNVVHVGMTPGGITETLSKWHSHQIVMNDFDGWDDRPRDLARTKFALVRRVNGRRCRTVCVLANNGHAALDEACAACANGIPIIVMKGSGGLADELATAIDSGSATSSVFGDWTERVQEMLASRCLYVFAMTGEGTDHKKRATLMAMLRCHLMADLVTMTRMLNDQDAIYTDSVWFEYGNLPFSVMLRVGLTGRKMRVYRGGEKYKHAKERGRKGGSGSRSRPSSASGSGLGSPPPPASKSSPPPPASIAPNLSEQASSEESTPDPASSKQTTPEEEAAALKIEAAARGRADRQRCSLLREEREKKAADDPGSAAFLDDSKVIPGKVVKFPVMRAPTSYYKNKESGYFARVLEAKIRDDALRLELTVRFYGNGSFLTLPKNCLLKQGEKRQLKMKNIKKERSKKRDKSSKIEEEAEYDTIDAVCSYAIDGLGQPLRGLKWQGGGKPYSEASVPTQELNEDGLEYSARNKMESKARRKEARVQMKKMQMEAGRLDTNGKKGEQKKGKEKEKGGKMSEDDAAKKIEARVRGNADRKKVAEMRKKQKEQLEIPAFKGGDAKKGKEKEKGGKMSEDDAAKKIEARVRGNADRKKVAEMKKNQKKK